MGQVKGHPSLTTDPQRSPSPSPNSDALQIREFLEEHYS